jgi:hypothetical protein
VNAPKIRYVAAVLCLAALVACSSKAPDGAKPVASIAELEAQVHHHVFAPGEAIGAQTIATAVAPGPAALFVGQIASVSYKWRDHVVLVRQGRAASGFSFAKNVARSDAVLVPKDANGVELALLPGLGPKGFPIGYRLQAEWLLEVDIAIGNAEAPATLDDLRAFTGSLV